MNTSKKILAVVLAVMLIMSCAVVGSAEEAEATYTYRTTLTDPMTWSPTDWQNSSESTVIGYTSSTFYSFEMNEDADGYDIIPTAASAMPVDVTAELTDEQREMYDVPADATEGYAWTIELNDKHCWANGDPINVDTYIYSLQQYLNPEMKNYRASSYYTGNSAIANAKDYYTAGGIDYQAFEEGTPFADLKVEDGKYVSADGEEIYLAWSQPVEWMGGSSWADYIDLGYGIDEVAEQIAEGENADGYVLFTEEVKDLLFGYTSSDEWGNETEDDLVNYLVKNAGTVEGKTWDEVGFIKNDDYSFTVVLDNPTTEFYVCYSFAITPVYEPLYEANKVTTGNITKSSYGTTADSYMSCGPYKIDTYQPDKQMTLSKNENWYGYTDEYYGDKYQTTNIELNFISENSTALSLFLQGNLDDYTVDTEHMEAYATSDYIYFMPQSYTFVFNFNSDLEALKKEDGDGINHSILSLDDFRHAISLSLDRQAFVAQCLAGADAGYGLINYVYVCDPDTGELYRDSEFAQQALCEFYGVESEDEITGYDKEAATELFEAAYQQALEQGLMTETDKVQLDFHVYADTTNYQNRANFLQSSIEAATVGTGLEGKVSVNMMVDEDYYGSAENGLADVIFGAWGGADMDPYSIMECYCTSDLKLTYGFNPEVETFTLTIGGEEKTMTAYEWYVALCEGEYATADLDVRNEVLAKMEKAILEQYELAVLCYDNEAVLYSQRIVLGSDYYINSLVGFGGISRMTYTMNDAEWADYCAQQNNQLTY
ncbi:MAG: ABC transporter substrate-binding protein [Clostridia bacterium]|nr:ABC transporter substrate-binding protein [Clostridia bacterium]